MEIVWDSPNYMKREASIELALVVKTLVYGSSAWTGLENANHATSTSIILGCDSEHSLVA